MYGNLEDFTDHSHQYKSLLEDDYDFVNNIEFADIMSGRGGCHISSVPWQRSRER